MTDAVPGLRTAYIPTYAEPGTPAALLDRSTSAVLGGSTPALRPGEPWPRCAECDKPLVPYIQINLSSPHTPAAFRDRFPGLADGGKDDGRTPIFQVLVCAEDENAECLQDNVVSNPEGGAWLIRVVHVTEEDLAAVENARKEIGEDRFFVVERVISGWAEGMQEVEHCEVNWGLEDDIYERHAPAEGLKLLGWPVRGMTSCSPTSASAADSAVPCRQILHVQRHV